ncbi:MAG TPA: ATP-binding protein [Anaerolineae bacterium]|nr:ATP-binding protein [Anaerolineae bacterium]
MSRLWVRLTLAFGLVVLVAMGAIGLLINRTTDLEFRRYITRSDMQAAGRGVDQLVEYYLENSTWDGVDALLAGGVWLSGGAAPRPASPSGGLPPQGAQIGETRDAPPIQVDVLLADARGLIIYDSTGVSESRRLKTRDKEGASAITHPGDGSVIGYLLVSISGPADRLGSLEQAFLYRIRRVLFIGGAFAVGLVVIVGALLSRSLTAPLQRLAAAAREVAKGHLGQKVRVEGSPEVAEVGRAFNEMTFALSEAETQRKNMVADVSHELRTPLSVLQGNLRAILDGVYPLDQAEIARLYDESLLLGRMVEDLRELALADAGQLRLEVRRTGVAQLIHDSLDKMAMLAQDRQVTMVARLPDALPAVMADSDRVGQVLRNLLLNAAQNTPAGGTIAVTARPADTMLELSVSDTGAGISAEDLPHVFERFWRADPSRSRASRLGGGSGIGLAVAQSLVAAQGGRIWAESTPGQGTTFRFTLPLAPPAAL